MIKKMKKVLLFLVGCLICEEVFATIFSVIPTDQSKQYLGLVFGGSVGAIDLGGGSYNNTLSLMFERFNFIIVTIGAIALSYIGIISLVNTAREGEALGKKISLWVPLRSLLGMLLMVPGPTSGYSVVQMTVMWIVLNGIGAANAVWNVVLGQLAQNVSAIGGLHFDLKPTHLSSTVQAVLNASTCMYSINNYMPELSTVSNSPFQNYGPIRVYAPDILPNPIPAPSSTGTVMPGQITQNAIISVGLKGAPPPFDTICGFFTVKSTLSQGDPINNFNYATVAQRLAIKMAALQAMFNALDPAAQLLASPIPPGPQYAAPDPGYVYAAGQAYIGQIAQLATGIKAIPPAGAQPWEATSASVNPLTGNYQTLQSYGWIHAGSYYYTMVQATTATMDNETIPGLAKPPDPALVPVPTALNPNANNMPMGNGWQTIDNTPNTALTTLLTGAGQTIKLNTALNHATTYWTNDNAAVAPPTQGIAVTSPSTGNSYMDSVVRSISDYVTTPILNYMQSITSGAVSIGSQISGSYGTTVNVIGGYFGAGDIDIGTTGPSGDPLLSIGQFGSTLMLAAEVAVFASLVTSIALSLALSSASCVSPFAWGINLILVQLVPLIYGIAILLWTAGATLGVYIPLVPYLIFTTSSFGWIIAVIEAVVGAPIIALALVTVGGEELGKAGNALLILANIFLRPVLMIFGFVLGAGLLRAGIALVNFGFIPALTEGTNPSVFSILAVLMMYMFLIMAIVNKSFSLIYMLPNQIMRYAGGTAETFEPGEMIKEAQTGFKTGADQAQQAGSEIHRGGREKMAEMAKGSQNQPPGLPSPGGGPAPGGPGGGPAPGGPGGGPAPGGPGAAPPPGGMPPVPPGAIG